jgi:hypothetical protein
MTDEKKMAMFWKGKVAKIGGTFSMLGEGYILDGDKNRWAKGAFNETTGLRQGRWTYFFPGTGTPHEDGIVQRVVDYSQNVKSGLYIQYNEEGVAIVQRQYVNDEPVYEWIHPDLRGETLNPSSTEGKNDTADVVETPRMFKRNKYRTFTTQELNQLGTTNIKIIPENDASDISLGFLLEQSKKAIVHTGPKDEVSKKETPFRENAHLSQKPATTEPPPKGAAVRIAWQYLKKKT